MTKVKIFVYGRRRRQQRRRRGYDNSSPDFRHGELIKNIDVCKTLMPPLPQHMKNKLDL